MIDYYANRYDVLTGIGYRFRKELDMHYPC